MKRRFVYTAFFNELEAGLPASSGQQRIAWAEIIVQHDLSLQDLAALLKSGPRVATRFLWLLSDVGIQSPEKLLRELPELFRLSPTLPPTQKCAFASLWNIAGVPKQNEAEAIELLFQWFMSPEINVTMKSRSLWVLARLTQKYPDLKNELALCIKDQMSRYTREFEKRAAKILTELKN